MAGMWANAVGTAEPFQADLAVLLSRYPELSKVIDDFSMVLASTPKLTRIPVDDGEDEDGFPRVFAHILDYPPLGKEGLQLFRVTYYAPPRGEANPWQRFTLLSIKERPPMNADCEPQ